MQELQSFGKTALGPILYLVRHGETEYNRKKIFQGRSDIPLNDRGIEQACALRELLAPVSLTRAFVSPLDRAKTTAAIILKDRDVPQTVEERLTEIFFGEWEGTPEETVRQTWVEDYMDYRNDMSRFRPQNGESALEAQRRSGEWWDEISIRYSSPEEHILVVSHQSLNAVLACYVAGVHLKDAWQVFKTKPGEVMKIMPGRFPQISRMIPDME